MTRSKILIFHQEGNINNNPNLSGIVESLCENGYEVDILSPKLSIHQESPCNGSRLIFYNNILNEIQSRSKNFGISNFILSLKHRKIRNNPHYNFIIGVDRDGIIEASSFSHLFKLPYGLISYEIFSEAESSKNFKDIEIEACKDIEFAVCQDHTRSALLATENRIPLDKIINIPVAGRGIKRGMKTRYLYTRLGIPVEKRIALFAGSIAKWSMIEDLIQSVNDWPKDWVLVLHHRYGLNSRVNELIKDIDSDSIYISNDLYPKPGDLSGMLHSVDLGIALYKPLYTGIYDGINLECLGLSSGKIATYLQHGIPVLTNENGLISEYIREYQAGCVIGEIGEISEVLGRNDFLNNQENCFALFDKYLNLDAHIDPFLKRIEEILNN